MNLSARLSKLVLRLDDILLGSLVQLIRANRKVLARVEADQLSDYEDDPRLEHTLETLREAREFSVARLQRIEDKAKGTVIGVGLGVTVIGSAVAFLGKDSPVATGASALEVQLALLLGAAIVFLLLSGYLALRAYEIGRVWLPSLYDAVPLVPEAEAKEAELQCIEQNYRMGTVRANYLDAAFDCLRNGLVLLVVAAGLLLVLLCIQTPAAPAAVTANGTGVPTHHSVRRGCGCFRHGR